MNGIGLVLSGGGGTGGYQIGVWKYLREIGLDRQICAVSGTSAGALNTMLFADGDYDKAERIWRSVTPNKILHIKLKDVLELVSGMRYIEDADLFRLRPGMPYALQKLKDYERAYQKSLVRLPESISHSILGGQPLKHFMTEQIATFFREMLGSAMISQDIMQQMMREEIVFSRVKNFRGPCFITCVEYPRMVVRRFDLRDHSPELMQKIVLASAAIPVIYDPVEIDGLEYYDGGTPPFGDGVPVQPVYDHGVDTILVVHLHRDRPVCRADFPGANIIEFVPSRSLGGVLDFGLRQIERRIELGYEDAREQLRTLAMRPGWVF